MRHSVKAGRKYQMNKVKIQRKVVAVLIKTSPSYFTIPLKSRLDFIKFFSQKSVYDLICEYNPHLINSKSNPKQHNLKKL